MTIRHTNIAPHEGDHDTDDKGLPKVRGKGEQGKSAIAKGSPHKEDQEDFHETRASGEAKTGDPTACIAAALKTGKTDF